VKDGLGDVSDSVARIRTAIRFVRSSPSRWLKFKNCVEHEKIASKGLVCLDCDTRWNSTFLMLDASLKFQKAFERMEEDAQYVLELTSKKGIPDESDWGEAKRLVKFLKKFYDATLRVSGFLHVTSHFFFHEIFTVGMTLTKWIESSDSSLKSMALKMKNKFDKYWGDPNKINMLLYFAVIVDPRYKLKYVKFVFEDIYGESIAKDITSMIHLALVKLYEEYNDSVTTSSRQPSSPTPVLDDDDDDVDPLIKYKKHKAAEMYTDKKLELDRYLEDPQEQEEDNYEFDILAWWKVNSSKYRVLSQIARDVLAIPISTVPSESAFSTGGRILDAFRSSLTPFTAEAIICTQDWLRASPLPVSVEENFDELEVNEIESGISINQDYCISFFLYLFGLL
jgi:hypothetical protein